MTTTTEAITLDTSREPEDLTTEEFDQVAAVLKGNVNAGYADPLLNLDTPIEQLLLRLAYHDGLNLDRLERIVREAIRQRGDGEPAARRFTFKAYRSNAKAWKAKVAESKLMEAAIRRRNLKVLDGGKADREQLSEIEAQTSDVEAQARMFSQNAFLKALGILMGARPGRIWYDTFYSNFFSNWDGTDNEDIVPTKPVEDEFILRVYEWLLMQDNKLATSLSANSTQQAIQAMGFRDIRREPRDWITSLTWDGVERLPTWLASVYGVEQNEYHAAVGRCWLVSMAARIMTPGCKVDTMPVLIGPQGNRKSTSLGILGGKWYATVNTSVEKLQDFLMSLQGVLVAEIAELDAISRAADSRVKTVLSTAVDKFRPPYGRTVQEFLRTAVLSGSTNDKSFHKDDTGGRRYWPIECYRPINTEWLSANREQLFAEALMRFSKGELWWDVPVDEQERRVMEYRVEDPWQARIAAWIPTRELWLSHDSLVPKVAPDAEGMEEAAHWGTMLTTSRVLTECLQIPTERQNRITALKVASALRNLGLEQRTVRIKSEKGWQVVRAWIVTHDGEQAPGQMSLPIKE